MSPSLFLEDIAPVCSCHCQSKQALDLLSALNNRKKLDTHVLEGELACISDPSGEEIFRMIFQAATDNKELLPKLRFLMPCSCHSDTEDSDGEDELSTDLSEDDELSQQSVHSDDSVTHALLLQQLANANGPRREIDRRYKTELCRTYEAKGW
eukprot:CAMPEP_0196655970 /NCGR_PEP_ID=MMETSP1086-20130531/11813_1 /TAXON_ID=77921 /ORGANISM="Cyanoptyche  gloeocystis , Strain SAG4.97" /LENGTH=152 /DNA_ID=CAMNT_0041988535 /DNA_START=77 /DNA_END=532 /DNA_ORIENTATION=-